MPDLGIISDDVIQNVMQGISQRPFHTGHFVAGLQTMYPEIWNILLETYGEGGRGAGRHYSANSAVSQALNRASKRDILDKLPDYMKSPPEINWGNPVIRYWTDYGGFRTHEFPEELTSEDDIDYPEGAVSTVLVNRYERNPAARAACISHHGATCKVCGIDFGKRYGRRGRNFIHVHHLVPVHQMAGGYAVDPISDLVPVCPNCHAMIHREAPMLTVEQLRSLLAD